MKETDLVLTLFAQQEDFCSATTLSQYSDIVQIANDALCLIFELGGHINEPVDNRDSPDSFFKHLAQSSYHRSPFTIKSVCDLAIRGYYIEAMNLVRHLYESYATVRYFHDHRGKIEEHILARSTRNRVSFFDRFEYLATGFYNEFYRLMSSFAHSGLITTALRYQIDESGMASPVIGLNYNGDACDIAVRYHAINISYALLSHLDSFFPSWCDSASASLKQRVDHLSNELFQMIDKPRLNPDFESTHRSIMIPFLNA